MGEEQEHTSEDELVTGATPAYCETDYPHNNNVPRAAGTAVRCEVGGNRKEHVDSRATITVTETIKGRSPTEKSLASALSDADAEGKQIPEYFSVLLEAMDVWGDSKVPIDSRPEWFDEAKFLRGQKFASDYFFGLMLAEMLSLLVLFSFADSLQPLIFSGNSDTPYKAFRRYLSTVSRVRSWYESDPWAADGAARRNLRTVRAMHAAVRRRLNGSPAPTSRELNLNGRGGPVWSTLLGDVHGDFRSSCCPFGAASLAYGGPRDRRLFINQADMALTQFGFVGLMLVHPEKFGAAGACDADLEGFAHLWRVVGHLLGIEDRYNFCAGSLADVRKRSEDVLRLCVRPNLCEVTAEWEHMSRCMVEGISYYVPTISFEASLYYLTRLVGVESPRLYATMTVGQRFMFHVMWFVMCYLLRLPGAHALHNWLLRLAIKKAEETSPEQLAVLENRRYPYQKCKPTVCTSL